MQRPPEEHRRVVAWREERTQRLKARLASTVCPLVRETERGLPDALGSCVLLRIDSRVFAQTAAHVLDWGTQDPLAIGLQGRCIDLGANVVRSADPALDIGIVEIPSTELEGIKLENILTLADLDVDERPRLDEFYVAAGFPIRKMSRNFGTRRARFDGISVTGKARTGPLPGSRRSPVHLAIEFNRKAMWLDGHRVSAPYPEGMSGGALVRFSSLTRPDLSVEEDKLVGILIEHHGAPWNMLIATHIALFVGALRQAFPELHDRLPESRVVRVRDAAGPASTR